MKLGKEVIGDEIVEEADEVLVVEESEDFTDREAGTEETDVDDVEKENTNVGDEYGEMNPIHESRIDREIRIMTEQRNAPDDVKAAKWSDKHAFIVDKKPKASFLFRLIESFMSATSWPAAVIAACLMSVWVVVGYCSPSVLLSAIIVLVAALAGYLVKIARNPMFSLVQDEAMYVGTGVLREEGQKNGKFKTISKVQRRSFRAGEYGSVFSSIILAFSFAIVSIFVPVEFAYFVSMIIMFGITWSMAGNYTSACAPYCDVYDIVFTDDTNVAAISFDTPIPGEERFMTPVDKHGVVFSIRHSTRVFLDEQSKTFGLNKKGHVVRRKTND